MEQNHLGSRKFKGKFKENCNTSHGPLYSFQAPKTIYLVEPLSHNPCLHAWPIIFKLITSFSRIFLQFNVNFLTKVDFENHCNSSLELDYS